MARSSKALKKKIFERKCLDRAIADLGWNASDIEGRETPDFELDRSGEFIGVEVRRVFRREAESGSVDAARESIWKEALKALAESYYADPKSRPISVTATFPPVINSPAVRQLALKEFGAEVRAVCFEGLRDLRSVQLAPGERREFTVRLTPDSRATTFCLTGLPDESDLRGYNSRTWKPTNCTTGWVGYYSGPELGAAIAEKAAARLEYASQYASTVALLVADGRVASGFGELGRGPVPAHGFDEIYFQRYPYGKTLRVARREDPVESKEASEIAEVAARGEVHNSWCVFSKPVDEPCQCEAAQSAEVNAAIDDLLQIVRRVTEVGDPDRSPEPLLHGANGRQLHEVAERGNAAIGETILIASEIAHHVTSSVAAEILGAVERVRDAATPRRPVVSSPSKA